MPLYKGNTKVGAIYKGTTQYGKVYKGSTLVFESAKWLPYYYEYLYHDLVPTTIDSKNVKDKAKVATIYGNSMVENQLADLRNSGTPYNVTVTNNGDGTLTFNGTANANGYPTVLKQNIETHAGHYYLIVGGTTQLPLLFAGSSFSISTIYQVTSSASRDLQTFFENGTTYNETKLIKVIDLTQMFPFDTPTTLTDNRVQALLNRGYIPYNTGEIKSVDIGEIESEIPRLPSEYQEVEYIESTGTQYIDSGVLTSYDLEIEADITIMEAPYRYKALFGNGAGWVMNLVTDSTGARWVSNTTSMYTFNYTIGNKFNVKAGSSYCSIDNVSISPTSDTNGTVFGNFYIGKGQSVHQNAAIRFYSFKIYNNSVLVRNFVPCYRKSDNVIGLYDLVNNVFYTNQGTGTFVKGADTITPKETKTLQLKYQGSGVGTAHNTMEITKDYVVFTKRMHRCDLGTLTWTLQSNYSANTFETYISDMFSFGQSGQIFDGIICSKYYTSSNVDTISKDKVIGTYSKYIRVRDTNYTNATDFKTAMSGVPLQYELATPQVITIPRNKLNICSLRGSHISWQHYSNTSPIWYGNLSYTPNISNKAIYCDKYLYVPYDNTSTVPTTSDLPDKSITFFMYGGSFPIIYIRDDSMAFATYSEWENYVKNILIFFENATELTEIPSGIDIQAGGTLTSHKFSMNLNQLLDTNSVPSTQTQGNVTLTNNGDGSYTLNGTATESVNFESPSNVATVVVGHKYLQLAVPLYTNANQISCASHSMSSYYSKIATATSTEYSYWIRVQNGAATGFTYKPMLIDLTVAFGEGNEPTSIYDPRIEYIASLGYIPYNTTGTKVIVDGDVLPNAEFEMKCS